MRYLALATLMALAACQHLVKDGNGGVLANCYDGAFTSFCRVNVGPGQGTVTGSGIVPTVNSSASLVTESVAIDAALKK